MRQIDVSTRKFPGAFALVDDDDFARLSRFKWSACRPRDTIYAVRAIVRDGKRTTTRMHCEIMGVTHVDHADGNGLNNQRRNLRPCTPTQNQHNRRRTRGASRFKGVSWHKRSGMWRSTIMISGRQKALGYFGPEDDAARAYDAAAVANFGEFAATNFEAPTCPRS